MNAPRPLNIHFEGQTHYFTQDNPAAVAAHGAVRQFEIAYADVDAMLRSQAKLIARVQERMNNGVTLNELGEIQDSGRALDVMIVKLEMYRANARTLIRVALASQNN